MDINDTPRTRLKTTGKAFTLIELLVVISIIGLLSSIILVGLNDARDKAQIASGQQFAKHTDSALYSNAGGVWSFNDTSNPGIDDSGNNNLTIGGAVLDSDSPYPSGKSLKFNGINDYAYTSAATSLNSTGNITVIFWVKADSFSPTNFPDNTSHWIYDPNQFGIAGSNLFWINIGQNRYFDTNYPVAIEINKWVNIAMSYSQTTGNITVYKNGKLIDSKNVASPGTAMNGTSNGIYISNPNINGIGPYAGKGRIDDVRLFTKTLISKEIENIYTQSQTKYLTLK